MGFRFRKSINLGGFRINLSKSGIGYSFGVKGLRYTHKAGGGSRSTIGIPGTGISYVKDHSAHKKPQAVTAERKKGSVPVDREIENEMIESSPSEMIDRLNRAQKIDLVFRACRIVFPLIGFLLFSIVIAIASNGMTWTSSETGKTIDGTAAAVVCGVLAAVFIGVGIFFLLQRVKIDLCYDFSDDANFEQEYLNFIKGFSTLKTAETTWELRDTVPREQAKITFVPLEEYIHTELETEEMKLLGKKILFLPDIIAVKQQNGWAGVSYTEIKVMMQDAPMEETSVPEDAIVLSERWLHAKKDGGRNMQFQNNNYLIYTCLYGKMMFSSENGLNVSLLCSSNEKVRTFCAALEKYIAFLKD